MTTLTSRQMGVQANKLLTTAWIATITASLLPHIAVQYLLPNNVGLFFWVRVGILAGLLIGALAVPAVRTLRGYLVLLLAFVLTEYGLRSWIGETGVWQSIFPGVGSGYFSANIGMQLLRLLPALLMAFLLLTMGFRRRELFLTRGEMNAPTEPVRWLDIKAGERWNRMGMLFMVAFFALTGLFLYIAVGTIPSASVERIIMVLPAVLMFAALNAANENFTYRAALLPVLVSAAGKQQALLMTAILFGIGHMQFGLFGGGSFFLSSFLGWVLGKSMLETRGFAWAWLIQFPLDILSFSFLALIP